MGLIAKTKMVPEHTDAVVSALADLNKTILKQLQDGWQPTEDIGPILTAAVKDAGVSISNAAQMGDEVKSNIKEFKTALVLSADDIADAIIDYVNSPQKKV